MTCLKLLIMHTPTDQFLNRLLASERLPDFLCPTLRIPSNIQLQEKLLWRRWTKIQKNWS